jgi:hypothetical protein
LGKDQNIARKECNGIWGLFSLLSAFMLVRAVRMQAKEAPEIIFAKKLLGRRDEGKIRGNEDDSIALNPVYRYSVHLDLLAIGEECIPYLIWDSDSRGAVLTHSYQMTDRCSFVNISHWLPERGGASTCAPSI